VTARAELPAWTLKAGIAALALVTGLLAGIDPKLGVIAALGLAYVLLVMSDLAVGLTLFTLVSFLEVLPSGGAPASFGKIAGLLLAISWLATVTSQAHEEEKPFEGHQIVSYLLVLLIGWAALSALWAEDAGATATAIYRLALNFALFPIVFTAVRSNRHITWVLAAFMFGASISAIYGIVSPAPPDNPGDIARLGGAGVDPNELAALLVAAVAFAAAFAAGTRPTPALRAIALLALLFCLVGTFLTFSRGGLVSLSVALVAAVVFGGRWRRKALVLLVVIAGGALLYFSVIATPSERQRVTHFKGGTGRQDVWAVGWRMVKAHPVGGIGAGNFPISSVHYLLEPGAISRSDFIVDHPKVAHNSYLQVLAELGVPGLAMYVGLILFSLACTLAAAKQYMRAGDERMELATRAVLVALLGILAADFFISGIYSKQLWLLLALGPALLAVARSETAPELEEDPPAQPAGEPALAPV
jgi:O-antigen ligase